jgi:nucleotide-binding universal stress UspA family protein
MSRNLYLVPHDFTAVGDAALTYAMHLGKRVRTEIQVVHIVADASKVAAAKQKLSAVVDNFTKVENVELTSVVHVGNIFEDIGKIATRESAQLIIMGTHGVSGMQKVFGSYAMKVVTSSNVPFLVIQKETKLTKIERIVIPIDLTKESLQIVNVAGDLAAIFDAELHVVSEKQNDEIFLQKMKNRILLVKNQYEERNLKSKVSFIEGSGSFQKKVLEYARKEHGDLLALAYHSESILPQFDKFAQTLITNDLNLPCLILNSKAASNLYF